MERRVLLIKAPPSDAPELGQRLAALPGVNHIFVTEGDYQLVALVAGKGAEDVAALVDRHIAGTSGVEVAIDLTAVRQYSHDEVNNEMIGFGP